MAWYTYDDKDKLEITGCDVQAYINTNGDRIVTLGRDGHKIHLRANEAIDVVRMLESALGNMGIYGKGN